VPCPSTITIDNQTLKNSAGEGGAGDYTYEADFAASCNNAFSSFWDVSGMSGDLLSDTAKKYYGLNQPWDVGFGETHQYMSVPSNLSRGLLAESLVGQGNVTASPLAMCSVAATVATGTFKQPIILPNYAQISATPMGSTLQGNLKTLMASVIAPGGTAAGIFPDNGQFFGKTGTAEYGPTGNPLNNSWFVVFDDKNDIAVCALAIDGSYGATTAGPECKTVFQKLGYI
jgi:cell division protein FtsI/penicillin-binding protein 2